MDARVKDIIDEMTDYGVLFDTLGGIRLSACIREDMLGMKSHHPEYQSLTKKLDDLDKWIVVTDDKNRIHETIDTNSSATGRMSHSKPNLSSVPKEYRFRKLFIAPEGYNLVGVDAKSLELRMLAHYMNDDNYIEEINHGDIHRANQMATGLKSRDKAKAFIYALIYGAGNDRLAQVIGRTPKEAGGIKSNFEDHQRSFKTLREEVSRASDKGWITGLDGRDIKVDKQYKALNYLLQSAGALVMKRALVMLYDNAKAHGIDFKLVLNIHDEIQAEVAHGSEDTFGKLAVDAIVKAGEYYNLRCPLDAKYEIGHNWGLTH